MCPNRFSKSMRPVQIEIEYANEDIAKLPLEIISNINERFDCCTDKMVALLMEREPIIKSIVEFNNVIPNAITFSFEI